MVMGEAPCHKIAHARYAVFYLARNDMGWMPSFPRIARRYGLDHTSVLYGMRRARELCDERPRFLDNFIAAKTLLITRPPQARVFGGSHLTATPAQLSSVGA
jgi:hypothetical protein